MSVCHEGCTPPCSYGCALRQKGLRVAPSALPSQMNSKPPPRANPAWERGIVSEARPGGTRMPVLAPGTTRPLRVKEYAQRRREIEAGRRANHNAPTP